MVFIRDEGVFDAPIDRIWKYMNDQAGNHRHESITEMVPREQKGNVIIFDAKTKRPDGKSYNEVWKFTMYPPDGFMVEVLEGPTKGTKQTHTYIPQGDKTKVIVTGDWKLAGADEETTKKEILTYLDMVFNEDNKNLQSFR